MGLIRPDNTFGAIYVSGDDQLIFCRPDQASSVYKVILDYVGPNHKANLGRICDPINYNTTQDGFKSF